MESDLFGPDVSEEERPEVVIEVGDPVAVRSWQFVNRWVFLAHQRPAALKELRELIEAAATRTAKTRGETA